MNVVFFIEQLIKTQDQNSLFLIVVCYLGDFLDNPLNFRWFPLQKKARILMDLLVEHPKDFMHPFVYL